MVSGQVAAPTGSIATWTPAPVISRTRTLNCGEVERSIATAPSAVAFAALPAPRTSASTRAPASRPICTAAVPTPPDAPTISRSSPAARRATVISPRQAVVKHTGAAAACSKDTLSGMRNTFAAGTTVYSAIPPGICSP